MGAFYDDIPHSLVDWIKCQHIFWVATAPLAATGTVNVSPKGYDSFNIVSPTAVWYLDCTGSGNETISHLREPGNGRLTILFSAFSGPPRIVRLFGTGRVYERDTPDFDALLPVGDERRLPGARAIIWLDVDRVGTSCGYSVPFYQYEGERSVPRSSPSASPSTPTVVSANAAATVKDGLRAYWRLKNAESVDGLPGLAAAGFPPEQGAIRKSRKGLQEAKSGRGRKVSGSGVRQLFKATVGAGEAGGGLEGVLLALLVGVVVGVWIGKEYL
ncbi:uncharacterized protein RHOBADRAFT_38639 [Rhodotorula graminis WP1]|uniref:Pyridoxamine 5'-phosphate oxidase N-terminal domain-containing protein n=1 Tax=Rhodotorula graminis (strain WP1) TaxID=578459 RepID=A0A0P9IU80_RHOGW|nr:uncharacterized protein RHOBADRAFT_38639 [Rhodotorula graminis WP1]KPV72972.1 hypothetical protein RHOBADRAFT_38639 [Rhodotorula graminis WP1]